MALKGRNFEELVKSAGFERAVVMTLRELIEEHNQIEKLLIENSQNMNQMVDLIQNFTVVAENMKGAHDTVMKRLGPERSIELPGEV